MKASFPQEWRIKTRKSQLPEETEKSEVVPLHTNFVSNSTRTVFWICMKLHINLWKHFHIWGFQYLNSHCIFEVTLPMIYIFPICIIKHTMIFNIISFKLMKTNLYLKSQNEETIKIKYQINNHLMMPRERLCSLERLCRKKIQYNSLFKS